MNRYEPTWSSLDHHPTPAWFRNAKFGLFIHYSPTWFADDGERPVPTAFDPAAIVDLAASAGMRYITFTTKHHDGFSNWPTAQSDFAASEPFGPADLVSPLVEAVRSRGLRLGFYYSWLDEHHPAYPDPEGYVEKFAHAQLRELVEWYDPDLIWGDGEWDYDAAHWNATAFAAWYYNQATERGRSVALNDRLGKDTRYYYVKETGAAPHGDFWTPEHQVFDGVMPSAWETCETMHDGWSHTADPNWREPRDLIHLLVDVVANNGNLLLNVGPRPDGSLHEREQTVLATFADWMAVNGPAIHGTRPYRPPVTDASMVPEVDWEHPDETWNQLCNHLDRDGPLRMTRRGTTAYAIYLGDPGDSVIVPNVRPRDGGTVELLGTGPVEHTIDGDDLAITVPGRLPCDHAVSFAIPLSFQV